MYLCYGLPFKSNLFRSHKISSCVLHKCAFLMTTINISILVFFFVYTLIEKIYQNEYNNKKIPDYLPSLCLGLIHLFYVPYPFFLFFETFFHLLNHETHICFSSLYYFSEAKSFYSLLTYDTNKTVFDTKGMYSSDK